jgi:hypothetical protein
MFVQNIRRKPGSEISKKQPGMKSKSFEMILLALVMTLLFIGCQHTISDDVLSEIEDTAEEWDILPQYIGAVPDSVVYYYFIKEYNSGQESSDSTIDTLAEIIEICTIDGCVKTPVGFTAITLGELHAKGYFSCSEAEARAAENGDISVYESDGYYKSSWIHRSYHYGTYFKKVYCGSKTSRSWWMPGPCYLSTETRLSVINWQLVNYYPHSGFWGYHWGWAKSHVYVAMYPATAYFGWRQDGNHKWNGGPGYVSSTLTRWW